MKRTKNRNLISNVGLLGLFLWTLVACDSGTQRTPNANAGDDQKVLVADEVTLDGNASTVNKKIIWTIDSQPSGSSAALEDAETLTPSFVADEAGAYVLRLSIDDGKSEDTVTVTAKTVLAVITNGNGSSITVRNRFGTDELAMDLSSTGGILSGKNSRGSVANYTWEEISGPFATTTGGNSSSTLPFNAPAFKNFLSVGLVEGEENELGHGGQSDEWKWQPLPISIEDTKMIFKLTVDDGAGNSDVATEVVYVQDDGKEIRTASGLPNVGVGTVVYLQGPNKFVLVEFTSTTTACGGTPAARTPGTSSMRLINDDWTWTLTRPSGSSAVFADSGTTTSSNNQFPKFIPDVKGFYTVGYQATVDETSTTPTATGLRGCGRTGSCIYNSDGKDHCMISGSLRINAAKYVGVGGITSATPGRPECAACHNGNAMPDLTSKWKETQHAKFYETSYSSMSSLAPEPYLWPRATVGYNTSASNGGFDDAVASTEFDVSAQPDTFAEFTAHNSTVAALSSIQCENCHGPGSAHNGDATKIGVSASQFGTCGQCHAQEAEWINSIHNSTGFVHGSGRYQASWLTSPTCTRCHTSKGFINYVEEGEEGLKPITETGAFVGIACAACHDPHDATHPSQLRVYGDVNMVIDNSTVNAGKAGVCYTCHDGLYSKGEFSCDENRDGTADAFCETLEQTADFYSRQVHYNPQAPVLEGKGALTDINKDGLPDFFITGNSFHSEPGFILSAISGDSTLPSENQKCVTCHMATGPGPTEPGFRHLGGHTFKVQEGHGIGHLVGGEDPEDTAPGRSGQLQNLTACTPCHNNLTTLNRTARADYDGDATIEGIQDEVRGLLLLTSDVIKNLDKVDLGTCDNIVADRGPCVSGACSTDAHTPAKTCTTNADCQNFGICTTGDDTTAQPAFCKTTANCVIQNVTSTSGTVNFGPCVTLTNKCTSLLPDGVTQVDCSTDTDCVVPDVLAYAGAGFNSAGKDARPCLSATTNKCSKDSSLSCTTNANCTNLTNPVRGDKIRRAIWNHNLIVRDGSMGVHNAGYEISVLQGTYKAIKGTSVPGATPR